MSIKGKLLTVVILVCATLGMFCIVSALSYLKQDLTIHIANASYDDLYAVSNTRAAILSQINQSMDYIFSDLEKDKEDYVKYRIATNNALNDWMNALKRSSELEDEHLEAERALEVQTISEEISQIVESAFALVEAGEKKEAYALMESDLMHSKKEVLFEKINVSVAEEIKKVNGAYDDALLQLGLVPWGNKKGPEQVEISRFYMTYFLTAYRVLSSIDKQDKELNDYIIGGDDEEERGFDEHGIEAKTALNEWMVYIKTYSELLTREGRYPLSIIMDLWGKNDELMESGHKVFELKRAGKTEAVEDIIESQIEPFIHSGMFPIIHKEISHAKQQIEKASQRLHDITFYAFLEAIVLLAVISGIIIYFVITMMRGIINSLGELRRGTEIVGSGALDHRIGLKTNDELGHLARSFDKMAGSLQHSEKKLRDLATGILTAQEIERKRISIGLHDDLGQSLSLLKLQVGAVKRKIPEDKILLHDECTEILQYIDVVIKNVRHLSRDLSPPILEDLGLSAAIGRLVHDFVKHYNVKTSLHMDMINDIYEQDTQIIIYRIFQEALVNIGKHAQAAHASAVIKKNGNSVSFWIEDDGKGFDLKRVMGKKAAGDGMGLPAMYERARMVDASIDINSREGEGTKIEITIPTDKRGV